MEPLFNMKCISCHQVLRFSVSFQVCGHTYCAACIQKIGKVQGSQELKCPKCDQVREYYSNLYLDQMITNWFSNGDEIDKGKLDSLIQEVEKGKIKYNEQLKQREDKLQTEYQSCILKNIGEEYNKQEVFQKAMKYKDTEIEAARTDYEKKKKSLEGEYAELRKNNWASKNQLMYQQFSLSNVGDKDLMEWIKLGPNGASDNFVKLFGAAISYSFSTDGSLNFEGKINSINGTENRLKKLDAICRVIATNAHLQADVIIKLGDNNLTVAEINRIGVALKTNWTIAHLHLERNGIDKANALFLYESLLEANKNTTTKQLHFDQVIYTLQANV